MPVLLLTGARSPARYHETLARFRECSAQPLEEIVLPEAGHAMHRDNAPAFDGAVLAFLARLRSDSESAPA
jgi:pimeloyl-ACP methyl ester carboxylesterase